MGEVTRTCMFCEVRFSYIYKGGRHRRYCTERCAHAAESARASSRAEAAKPPRPKCKHCNSEMSRRTNTSYCGALECQMAKREASKPPRPRCLNCGVEMTRRDGATYCGAQPCRTAKYHARQGSLPRCSVEGCESAVIAKGMCGSHYAKDWRSENVERSRDTARSRRALRREVRVESFSSREVFERDGWVCGLCSEPIPRDVLWPDLRSPSIDHVVPIARGGEHSLANVQAAHLSCNSRKQDRVSA